ncbi:hypothetical protein TrRE_jg7429, partial [Triparma retinervis]
LNALESTKKEFQKEVALMGELRSQNIVQILGAITRPVELVILMEYCEGGDLRGHLDIARAGLVDFGFGAQSNMLLDVSYGIRYLHNKLFIHGDFKSPNVLIDREGTGKVADFGGSQSSSMSSSMSAQKGSGIGTYGWAAPEVIKDGIKALGPKADVYSFGIVVWECATKNIPWEGMTNAQIIGEVRYEKKRPKVDESMDKDLRALMEQCWSDDPKDRPHFDEIVERLEAITPTKTKTVLRTSSNVSSVSEDGTGDLWERLKADCEVTGSTIPVGDGDDLVMAFEGIFLDGDDVEDRDALISLLDIKGNGTVSRLEFKKFLGKWKKSGKSMQAYLGNTGAEGGDLGGKANELRKMEENLDLKRKEQEKEMEKMKEHIEKKEAEAAKMLKEAEMKAAEV